MRHTIIFLLFLLSGLYLKAQDTIALKSGDHIVAKILEVNEHEVKYKKFTYQDGPLFVVSVSKISYIRYADGTKDDFSRPENAGDPDYDAFGYPRNLLSIDPLALAFGNAAMSYERFGKRGKWSFRIPVSVAVFEGPQNRTGAAFDVKWYPWGQGKARYYLGPSVSGAGAYRGYFYGGIMFINGVSFQPTKAFNITIDGGFGVGHVPYGHFNFFNGFIWRGGIGIGWRI